MVITEVVADLVLEEPDHAAGLEVDVVVGDHHGLRHAGGPGGVDQA